MFPIPPLPHGSFFRFIAANLSLTHFVTWDRSRYSVYRIPCFSFASADTRYSFYFLSQIFKKAQYKLDFFNKLRRRFLRCIFGKAL